MKLLATLLTAAMIFFGAHSVFALSGSVDAGLFPSEAAAVTAAKNTISDIKMGKNMETKLHSNSNCFGGHVDADGFKVEAVWVNGNSGIEKMYNAKVDYRIQCESPSP